MGDSETVVAQSSTVMDYTTYPSTACVDANSNYAHSGDSSAAVPDAKDVMPQSYPVADTSSLMQEANLAADGTSQSFEKENAEQVAPEAHTVAMISDQPALNGTNTNGNISNDVNSTSAAGDNGATTEQPQTDGVVLSAEAERLWNIVKANSTDFNAWTSLIEETEKTAQDNIMSIRKVYDSFLVEFPLCYGYWKKYADHEARFGAIDKVVEVYERAVQGVTYSVEIWLHYCTFAIGTYGDPDTVRRLFERGLAYVGTDYLSYPLWDKYIEYEYTHQQWSRLAAIYTRIFENPNQQLDRYFASFKDLVGSQPLPELRTAEETSSLESNPGADGQRIEGEVNSEGGEELSQPINTGLTEADEKEKYIAIREEAYKKAKEFDSKIIGFETAIRRPYFHVRPLIDVELENWHTYLDFIEKEGDFNKIVKLYERCLVACANYPEYWIRYILCMEACGSMDIAENALARATQVFVKRQPEIHLFAARFKEQHGDVSAARTAYQLVHSEIAPGLLEAIIDHANMERRLGNMEGAFSLYEQAIAIEKGKEQSQMLPLLFAQYSRFVYLVCGNVEKAREILVEAIQKVQLSKPLLEALLHLESIQQAEKRIDYLDDMVEKFISPDPSNLNMAPLTEREESSRIYLEFLGLFGDAVAIKKAKDRHFKLFIHHRSSSESRKRDADDLSSDKAKLMKPYAGVTSAPSVVGSYPAATQTQWPTGYVPQAQTWPPVAQVPAQGQTWNPGYTQQAAAAYPGYYGTNYAQPQVPTSVPQASAYGAYAPPTYPAQAYPQQAYATPATAAAAAPVQQPAVGAAAAAAPQTYYGATYY